jgi:hypothetical protein
LKIGYDPILAYPELALPPPPAACTADGRGRSSI